MPSKPCARPGCTGVVAHRWPCRVEKADYCSRRCGGLATRAQGVAGGRRGGAISGARKHRAAVERAAAACAEFLTPEIRDALGPTQLARVTVLFARAYRKGYLRGLQCAWLKRTHKQGTRQTEAA